MNDREVTARARELAAELRRARERSGRKQAEVARELGWSQTRICRMESGLRGLSELAVARLLAVLGVTGAEFDRLIALSRDAYECSWLRSVDSLDERRRVFRHEATATQITEYEPLDIPELLRTESYVRAVLELAGLLPEESVDQLVLGHLDRVTMIQRRVESTFLFFISEQALHSQLDAPGVMTEQLLHLVMAAWRSACTIRIVPAALGPIGLLGGPFRVLEYADALPVVHTRSQTTSVFLQTSDDIAAYRAVLTRLDALALNEAESRAVLADLANHRAAPEPASDNGARRAELSITEWTGREHHGASQR